MHIFENITTILFVAIIVVILLTDRSRQRQIDRLRSEFKNLLIVTESLRFRVYDHENQLLQRDGVFVPEDAGMFAFNLMWGILDEETKKTIEEEYKKVCPEHIPLWKYVLYNYKITPRAERKIELKRIESAEDLLNINLTRGITEVEEKIGKMEELQKKLSKELTNALEETEKVEKDIEKMS